LNIDIGAELCYNIYNNKRDSNQNGTRTGNRSSAGAGENLRSNTNQINTGRTPEKVRTTMKNMITMTAIIANANTLTAYAEYVCDYVGSGDYICDTFAEIANNNTSIYYNDIIHYISEHVEEVNDAIKEFGWDGCGNDLYKAGQIAECMQIENEMYSHAAEIVEAYAADYIRRNYAAEIPEETWERITDELERVDTSDRWETIRDAIDEIMAETAADAAEMTA